MVDSPSIPDLVQNPDVLIGVLLISLMNGLANAGGVGGGDILIPFMMIFFQLSIPECVPVANALAFISTLTRFIVNRKQRHPYRPWRVIIDYEVTALSMPIVSLGTMIGVQTSRYLSELAMVIML